MKQFSWSYSRLKNFETCGYRHLRVDIDKAYTESSDQLDAGNKVHAALAHALTHSTLPADMAKWQKWVDKISAMPGKLLVEQKYALTRTFEPTEYFGAGVWVRSIADVVRVDGPVAFVGDWKTGRIINHTKDQLTIVAQCIFSFYPTVMRVSTAYIWLNEEKITKEVFTREAVAKAWRDGLLDRVAKMEEAASTKVYLKKPGGLCKRWCVVQDCEFYKTGRC